MTRGWPIDCTAIDETTDHVHHKSLWVAYGNCNGVDNWSEDPGHGWQCHREFKELVSGPVFGRIVQGLDWCANDKTKQFEESRDIRFYALPNAAGMVDIASTFYMTEGQVVFGDTKEGGLVSVRVASSMDVCRGGRIENAYGAVNESETWGKRAPWCDYSGTVDGELIGIAVLDHEANPRYPTGWHVRDYGLMAANCFAWSHYRPEAKIKGDMTFEKDSVTTWRYRLYIHTGDATRGKVRQRFLDYIAPPAITIG